MHITLETDYAVRIVYSLALSNKRMDAKTIAESTGVTLRFSLKILRKLVGNGIIKSYKGTQGGYELAKSPAELNLNDIIETVEGPFTISRCVNDDFVCSRAKSVPCKFQKIYDEISCDVRNKLKAVKFSELLD